MNGLTRVEIAPREPVSAEVVRRLLDYLLLSGEIQPGQRIPSERQLVETLGVGRAVVREAIKALGFLGLLEIRQGAGTYFRGTEPGIFSRILEWGIALGEQRTVDLIHARGHLEVLVAGLAAQNRTDDDVRALHELLDAMRTASIEEPHRFAEADVGFHLRIAQASGNSVLANMLERIRALVFAWIGHNIAASKTTSVAYAEHPPILDAIERRDVDAARAAMEKHMRGATERLLSRLDAGALTQSAKQ
ncbi:transcriptional regulator [Mycolicibacterium agri]|uniref:Transcriptional regulator n=1 Tax=Mycolicibacterium agri TaxID=36811 RepID=A0A2A7N2U1_MYCAG|nr:FadR/GntR family transcriptional regulator [Mycolicibacterium agri]PEG38214.1 transcriptional regulator [Mycolicibacterium agri]GFG49320.1 GntR family transcriptional regulator [Mycolicibacterium agri]